MLAQRSGPRDTRTSSIWIAVCRVGRVWREMMFIAAFVAMVVTPADVVAMIVAIPPIFFGVCAAYGYAVWRTGTGADH